MPALQCVRGDIDAVERVDVLLVCSSGGHLLQLFALSDAWRRRSRAPGSRSTSSDARSLLAEGARDLRANRQRTEASRTCSATFVVAWRVTEPGCASTGAIVTTGAGVAVPFAWVGKLRGARIVYIESLSRIDGPSLSYRLIAPIADRGATCHGASSPRALPGTRGSPATSFLPKHDLRHRGDERSSVRSAASYSRGAAEVEQKAC